MTAIGRVSLAFLLLAMLFAQHARAGKQLASCATNKPRNTLFAPVTGLEERMAPYVGLMSGTRQTQPGERPERPTQAELYAIARQWDALSPSFRAAYLAAAAVPPGMLTHQSPTGQFDIIYTVAGIHRVDAADTYGYSATNWRQRIAAPNGVPDYIDEVAWACDSAWSMEVERFAFPLPHAHVSPEYPSSRYKVAILNLDSTVSDSGDTILLSESGYYGLTWPMAPRPEIGFASRIELRNNWNGPMWRDVAGNDYEAHPELAIHITCAHEYLHAIQYTMTHELPAPTSLDDFPVSWIEATAVLMEELGYDSVNDYLQYCGPYFHDPTDPVLTGFGYNSSVTAIYLYEFSPGDGGIGFIRDVFLRNHAAPTPYHAGLVASSSARGLPWQRLLGGFHARSYFTGSRARTGFFVKDAPLLPTWSESADTATRISKVVSSSDVPAFGMWQALRTRDPADNGTLGIQFLGRRFTTPRYDSLWGVHVLLRPRGADMYDTLIPMVVEPDGCDTMEVESWHSYDEALVVVTNAHGEGYGKATVAFDTLIVPDPLTMPVAIFPNPARLRDRTTPVIIRAAGLSHVRIYTIDGTLLHSADVTDKTQDRITWNPSNGRAPVLPGTYFVVIERRDATGEAAKATRHKILILP